jgi:hypothetical protein
MERRIAWHLGLWKKLLVSSYFRRPSGTTLIEWKNLANTTCNRKYLAKS